MTTFEEWGPAPDWREAAQEKYDEWQAQADDEERAEYLRGRS